MTFPQWRTGKLPALLLSMVLLALPGAAAGQGPPEAALTQADIDGYVYLAPRLLGPAARDAETAARLLEESGLSRRRALYVGTKIAVAQAMVTGALSPDQVDPKTLPLSMQPTAEELALVQKNLTSLTQAQLEALAQKKRLSAGEPIQ